MRCRPRRPAPLLAASLFLLALLKSGFALADVMSLIAPNGREATAEYRPGRSDLPAVLIVHGFLQTRAFPTVAALADGLAQAGFTVLTPTLTLNVSRRRHSLPCEAVHSHTFEMDVAEVAAWADWLERRGIAGWCSSATATAPWPSCRSWPARRQR